MAESEQFAAHATRFRTEAEEATLDNVRERCLRAAAAWESRAVSARRTETSRAQREAATAAARTLLQDQAAAMPAPMPLA